MVCFHCNHGKGRTGSAIICLILFTGFFSEWYETLKFYNKRRFSGENYGVSQPCQLRYIKYFNEVLKKKKEGTLLEKLVAYKWTGLAMEGLDDSYYLTISSVRSSTNKHYKVSLA